MEPAGSGNMLNQTGHAPRRSMKRLCPVALFALLTAPPASAGFADSLRDTRPDFNVRYRFENVDQDGIEKKARASTAKARLS